MIAWNRKRKNPVFIFTSIVAIVLLALAAGSAAVLFAALLLVLVIFYPFFLNLWEYLYGAEDISDQLFYAHTEDGWNVAMHFHRPAYPKAGAYPVILCHGLAVNKYGVDLDRSHSLAYYLKQNGYPVFVLSLRGVGKSYHTSRYRYQDFNFDDLVEKDVPAVIRKARELTGAPRVSWVGHSMGSMIAMGFLGRKLPGHEDVACLISIAGPGRVDHARQTLWGIITRVPWMNYLLDFRFGAQVMSPVTGRVSTPIEEIVYNKDNVNSRVIRKLMKNAIENISAGLAHQFVDWIETGKETTVDGRHDYRQGQKNLELPSLFMSGSRDHIAVPSAVRYSYEQCTAKHKEYIVIGPESGAEHDYCHTGMIVGDYAIEDVYPRALDWLERFGREKRNRSFFARVAKRFQRRQVQDHRRFRRRVRHRNLPPGVIQA